MPSLQKSEAKFEIDETEPDENAKRNALDYFSVALTTFGVGFIPPAPGTLGSAVGVLIYLFFSAKEVSFATDLLARNWQPSEISAWLNFVNLVLFVLFCLLGIWASGRATKIFQDKDPQKVVVDEVIGQIIVFLFVPFGISWKLVLCGFLLFRLFDIWKPYPIDSLQNLPDGIGVCADDIVAGIYGGICLTLLYAFSLTFN